MNAAPFCALRIYIQNERRVLMPELISMRIEATDRHVATLAALPPDFIRKMRNWARSRDGGPVSISSMEERVDHTRHEIAIPVLLGEYEDTDRVLRKLPQRYQEVIAVFWMHEGKPMRWMATSTPRLRVWKLGPTSFAQWLDKAHARMQEELTKQRLEDYKRRALSAAAQVRE
jgi:hypothetical protein